MRRLSKARLILVVLIVAAWGTPAHAYLDPGTGSIILQGLIAGIAGAALLLKMYWARIKAFFSAGRDSSSGVKKKE